MSLPDGESVNDRIRDRWCSLSYATATDITHRVISYGKGALMIIVDIRNVYRVVPIHLADRWLMEMTWEAVFVNTALPFGLCSAPKIFTAITDTAE